MSRTNLLLKDVNLVVNNIMHFLMTLNDVTVFQSQNCPNGVLDKHLACLPVCTGFANSARFLAHWTQSFIMTPFLSSFERAQDWTLNNLSPWIWFQEYFRQVFKESKNEQVLLVSSKLNKIQLNSVIEQYAVWSPSLCKARCSSCYRWDFGRFFLWWNNIFEEGNNIQAGVF